MFGLKRKKKGGVEKKKADFQYAYSGMQNRPQSGEEQYKAGRAEWAEAINKMEALVRDKDSRRLIAINALSAISAAPKMSAEQVSKVNDFHGQTLFDKEEVFEAFVSGYDLGRLIGIAGVLLSLDEENDLRDRLRETNGEISIRVMVEIISKHMKAIYGVEEAL